MQDDTEVISLWLAVAGEIDESLETFRSLCLEQVRVCSSIRSAVLRERAVAQTKAAFVDALAAIRA